MLGHMKALAQNNYSGKKIRAAGLVRALLENNPSLQVSSINGHTLNGMKLSTPQGHIKDVRIKYLPRIVPSQIATEDNCDNNMIFQYTESSLSAPKIAKWGFYLDWGFVERYQEEASRLVSAGGTPNVTVLNELLEQLMHSVNGLIGKIDQELVSSVVWGTNSVTGNNAVKTININGDSNRLDLSSGITEILSDAQDNEVADDLILVGNGLMNKFEIAKGSLSAAQNGFDLSVLGGYQWYHDLYTAAGWGANQVGAFAKGNVGFVDIDRWVAWKAGRHGNSDFLQIQLPVNTGKAGEPVQMMNFNVQIKEIDCPTEVFDGYNTRTVDRGHQVLITKNYGLWQLPADTYQAADPLNGVTGAFRYVVSNDCDPCVADA